MRWISLLSLLLLTQSTAAQEIRKRIEEEAARLVAEVLSDAVETTLVSEGRNLAFATCVGEFVAGAFRAATPEQREKGLPTWLDIGKQQCDPQLASAAVSADSSEQ